MGINTNMHLYYHSYAGLKYLLNFAVSQLFEHVYYSVYCMLCVALSNDDKDDAVTAAEAEPASVTTSYLNVEVKQGSLPQFSVCSRLLHV